MGFPGCLLGALMVLTGASPLLACGNVVRVSFVEASPDRLLIEYLDGHDEEQLVSVRIDLSRSAGRAYVDTAYGPARSNAGSPVVLDTISGFAHGTQSGTIEFRRFSVGDRFVLLVDLDDRGEMGDFNGNILTANELEDGEVSVRTSGFGGEVTERTGLFDPKGVALIGTEACA